MFPDLPPAAEGELGQTPFAHLAVYALDKRITGELFLTETGGSAEPVTHVVRFECGVPTKIRVGDSFARLGEILVERGLLDQQTLESALATRGSLLGDMLVLGGCVEPKQIDDALVTQFERRMKRFYSLPPSTAFKYFDKADTLVSWGGDASTLDPFRLLWMGIEAHGDASTAMSPTLDLLAGAHPLVLHARAPYSRFGFEGAAADVVDVLSIEPTSLDELMKLEGVAEEVVRRVIYTLMITRQLDMGKGGLPVGIEERPATVAKVQLKSTTHRVGAAIDAPADAERTPIRPITIRRGHSGSFELIPREEDLGASPESRPVDIVGPGPSTPRPPSSPREPHAAPPSSGVSTSAPESAATPVSRVPATTKSAKVSEAAPRLAEESKPEDQEEPSQQRLMSDALRGMPVEKLVELAIERLESKEHKSALEICKIAREKNPDSAEIRAVAIWASAQKPGADLKVFTVELDEAIRESDLALLRHVRGILRKRLGEDKGALADFKRALELDGSHERSRREIASIERPSTAPPAQSGGLLKRLFGR